MEEPNPKKETERGDAFTCKSTKPNFVEYWVLVGLSEMQTEQYCGALFSKADILCSCDAILLVSTKMCCDHPYLVDGSLCISLIQDISKPKLLDAEIKLSNKLLLLPKVLLEIKKRDIYNLVVSRFLSEISWTNLFNKRSARIYPYTLIVV